MDEKISSRALMYTVLCFLVCSSLLYGVISSITCHDTWIAVILGFIVSLPIVWIFATLCEKFPGKNLIQIFDIVFGKIIGKIISSLCIFYFFSLCIINSSLMGDFMVEIIMPETPKIAILIIFVVTCGYAVRKGLKVIAHYSSAVFFIALIALIAAILLLINKSKLSNLQPIFDFPFFNYVQSTQYIAILSFSNIFVFTMIFPNLKNPQKIKKPLFVALIIGFLFMLGVVLIDIVALGSTESLLSFPSFDVIRIIDVQNVITRMDSVYEVAFLMGFFFKISILIYVTVKAIAQLFNIQSYKRFVPIVCATIILFSMISYNSSITSNYIAANILPSYQMFFQLILPAIALITAALQGHRKK